VLCVCAAAVALRCHDLAAAAVFTQPSAGGQMCSEQREVHRVKLLCFYFLLKGIATFPECSKIVTIII